MQRFTRDLLALRLFSETQEGVALFDEGGSLVAWNAAARAITGWDESAAKQQDLLSRGAGMIEIRDGKWVDLRSTSVSIGSRELRLMLFADVSAQRALSQARRQLIERGLVDPVTRLSGTQIALAHLERSVALARRDARAVGVLSVGVEIPAVAEFVPIDELMDQLGKRVIAATRASDLAARFAESELLIVLTAMARPEDTAIVAVRLMLQLSRPYVLQGRERSATVSIGTASFPKNGESADAVLVRARVAMSQARANGGGYQVG